MTEKIYPAMSAVMKNIKAVGKDAQNAQQSWKYRSAEALYNHVHGLLAEAGVFMTTEILRSQRQEMKSRNATGVLSIIDYKIIFHADDGSNISTEVQAEASDYGDKASGKVMTYAMKTAIAAMFLVPTEDMEDPDAQAVAATPAPAKVVKLLSPAQIKRFNTMCGSLGVDRELVKKKAKVSSMKDIPAAWADRMEAYILQQGTPALLAGIEAAKHINEMEKLDESLSWYKKEDFADLHEKVTAKIAALPGIQDERK